MKKLMIGLLLSSSVFAADTDGFNPDIFASRKWKDYDQCETAMFMITFGIRNEYNTKRIIYDEKKAVWHIYVGKTLELTCMADGYYTGHFKDDMPKGTYTNPSKRYGTPEDVKPRTPDIAVPQNFEIL